MPGQAGNNWFLVKRTRIGWISSRAWLFRALFAYQLHPVPWADLLLREKTRRPTPNATVLFKAAGNTGPRWELGWADSALIGATEHEGMCRVVSPGGRARWVSLGNIQQADPPVHRRLFQAFAYIYGQNMATEYILCECNSSRKVGYIKAKPS